MDKELTKIGYPYIFINALIIVKINYTDFLNNEQEEFYDASFADGILIEEDDFRIDLFKNKKSSSESIPISELDEAKIKNYVRIVQKPN